MSGCSGGAAHLTPATSAGGAALAMRAGFAPNGFAVGRRAAGLSVSPNPLKLLGTGAASKTLLEISEKGYKGGFSLGDSCADVATFSPASLKKAGSVAFEGKSGGSCSVVVTDTIGNSETVAVTDTVVSVRFNATTSGSPEMASVAVRLLSPDKKGFGAPVVTDITASECRLGKCAVAGPPAPPGKDKFLVTTFDKKKGGGTILATNSATMRVKAAKNNALSASLLKVVSKLSLGGASGTAGSAKSASLELTAKDPKGVTIVGKYEHAVTIGDSDTSGATTIRGGSAGGNVFTDSEQKPRLSYTGLAIGDATLTASAKGVADARARFAVTSSAPVYSGPEVSGIPEIDLYSTTSGSSGFSGSFTVAQTGWNAGSFDKAFTYKTASTGSSPNCGSYAISPASGSGKSYTVSATASSVAGECDLIVTGGAGKSTTVLLTFTTSSIGVNGKRGKP